MQTEKAVTREGRGAVMRLAQMREIGVAIALLGLIVLFSLLSSHFLNVENFINIIRQISLLGIIAMGMTLVIVCGEIDLSVGSIYGASAIFTGVLMTSGAPVRGLCILSSTVARPKPCTMVISTVP